MNTAADTLSGMSVQASTVCHQVVSPGTQGGNSLIIAASNKSFHQTTCSGLKHRHTTVGVTNQHDVGELVRSNEVNDLQSVIRDTGDTASLLAVPFQIDCEYIVPPRSHRRPKSVP